jgi:hypothetical protein
VKAGGVAPAGASAVPVRANGLIIRLAMNSAEPTSATPSLVRRRRTFLAPLWLLALGGVAVLVAGAVYWNSATTTTVVLVRHAEKELSAISDAPLSPEGETRATRLAHMFGDGSTFGRVRKIYVTNTRRTQQTAAALEQRLNIPGEVVEAKTGSGALAHRVGGFVSASPKQRHRAKQTPCSILAGRSSSSSPSSPSSWWGRRTCRA